jgi:methylated-DNA-[protein]-cysteine S-methyltransferase
VIETHERFVSSPVGALRLVAGGDALIRLAFAGDVAPSERVPHPVLDRMERELAEYFEGTRTVFEVPLAPKGTPFQLAVWKALDAIPFGELRSYKDVAVAIGRPTACRAVGAANGQNPIAIVLPCHRVIGSSGDLTGYGGGMPRKKWLLAHESKGEAAGQRDLVFA